MIPATLYGPPPTEEANRWRLVLDVHPQCEQEAKKRADNLIAVVQRASLLDGDAPLPQQDFNTVRKLVDRVKVEGGDILGLRAKPLIDGVRLWVRGLHSALYSEYWNQSVFWIEPPTPGFNTLSQKPHQEQLETAAQRSKIVRQAVGAACLSDNWDGLECWGGRVTYYCAWHHVQAPVDEPWICFWELNVPRLMEWSASVRTEPVPWHGCYRANEVPEAASLLTQENIDLYNKTRAAEDR